MMAQLAQRRLLAAGFLAWGVLVLVGGAVAQPVGESSEFSERISVMAIEIPVRVLVDGQPVAGLTKESFRVREAGEEHEIVGFEVVDLTTSERVEGDAPASPAGLDEAPTFAGDGRRILFLFDTVYSSRKHLMRGAVGARQLVERGLHPSDRAAVATYSGNRGLSFVTGFTADQEAIVLAIDAVAAGVGGDREAHGRALRSLAARTGLGRSRSAVERFRELTAQFGQSAAIAFESAEADLGVGLGRGGGAGAAGAPDGSRFGAIEPVSDPSRSGFQNIAPGQIAAGLAAGADRSGVRAFSLELVELATVLRDLPGQKHLFLLSQGFSPGLLEDSTALFHLEKALEALRRSNWAIQAIDIEGVPEAAVSDLGAHALFFLANETGGELIANHNDLELATAKLVDRTAVSYVLTIQPTDVLADGRYRPLEVKLEAGGPRRARVIHRPGYYAPKPRGERNSLENTLDATALLLSGRETRDLDAEVLAMALPGGDLAQVPVVFEIAAADLGKPARGGLWLEFHGYALDRHGVIQDLFSQRLRLGRKDVEDQIKAGGGVRFYDRVSLPAGEYDLRLLARNLETGASFLSTLPLVVPAGDERPELSGPLFVAEDGWAVLRGEGNLNGGRGVEHPFVLAGRPRIPSLSPVLTPGESATVFLATRGLESQGLLVRARILDSSGVAAEGGELAFRQRVLDTDNRLEALLGTFTANELEPGAYRLEVTASWKGGRRESVGVGEFRVVPN